MKRRTQLLSVLTLSVGLTSSASSQAVAPTPDRIADQVPLFSLAPTLEKMLPVVVNVRVGRAASQGQEIPKEFKKSFGDGLPDRPTQPFEGLGSGVIISASKDYVLINNYVINQAQKISIQLNDGCKSDAKLIDSDDQSDIALLQIQNPGKLTQIAIVGSGKLCVGDSAAAAGNPFGLGQTATSGIIPTPGRSGLNLEGLENFIQTDVSINCGNSGGALLNLNGELTGIDTAIPVPGDGSVGIGFVIPSNMVQTLAQQLVDFGEIKHGLLGIKSTEMSTNITKTLDLDVQRGVFVSKVLLDPGSAKADVKADDTITSLNGRPSNSSTELRSRITTTEPSTRVKLGLLRNGKPLEVEVTLDTSTSSSASTEMITPALGGATLNGGQLKDGGRGIKIDEVVRGSPVAQVGLQRDDVIIGVNCDRVNSTTEMCKVLVAKLAVITLQIVRGNESIYLLVR